MPETHRSAASLEALARDIFVAMGAGPDIAATVAGHLVRANLSGHDSHGVLRIPQYIAEADRGSLLPAARPELVSDRGAIGILDAHRGFGHSAAAMAMEWASERALEVGIAAVAIQRANHLGRIGEYAEIAAARGVIGIATVGVVGGGGVTPFGGRGRFLGTNPWAIGVPGAGDPMIFDAATSAIAEGKLRVARSRGVAAPAGTLVDAEGKPSTDPGVFYAGGALLPLGGELAGHKGYGLALASALIGGLAMVDDDDPTPAGTTSAVSSERWLGGAMTIAIDPARFGVADRYRAAVEGVLTDLRRQPPADGFEKVMVPGDPERASRERRSREGIPIANPIWAELVAAAARYGVLPEG